MVFAKNLNFFQAKDLFDRITKGGDWSELRKMVEDYENARVIPKTYTVQFNGSTANLFIVFDYEVRDQETENANLDHLNQNA